MSTAPINSADLVVGVNALCVSAFSHICRVHCRGRMRGAQRGLLLPGGRWLHDRVLEHRVHGAHGACRPRQPIVAALLPCQLCPAALTSGRSLCAQAVSLCRAEASGGRCEEAEGAGRPARLRGRRRKRRVRCRPLFFLLGMWCAQCVRVSSLSVCVLCVYSVWRSQGRRCAAACVRSIRKRR